MGSNLLPSHRAPSIPEDCQNLGIVYPAQITEGWKNDHKIILETKKLHLEFVKLAYEYLGEDYKGYKQEIPYESEVYKKGLAIHYPMEVNWSNVNWYLLCDPRCKQDAVDAFIQFFRYEVGIQDYVIAGMMGCIEHESGFYAHRVCLGEKYGGHGLEGKSHAIGPEYGAGFWANTGGFKFKCQDAIGGYAFEAQPLCLQMHLSFGKGTGDKFRSLTECIQCNLPWKPDIKDIIKKRLKNLKEIPPDKETGKNQYWDEKQDISELEEFAVKQACDCWSWCGEHGSYGFYTGPKPYLSLRQNFGDHLFTLQPDHQTRRRKSAFNYYKYMKHKLPYSDHF